MRRLYFTITIGVMALIMLGCGHVHQHGGHGHGGYAHGGHGHGGHEHDENLQLTAYNDLFEVHAEVSPLVVDETAEVVAHFTWLRDFKPLEAGTVTATLTVWGESDAQTRYEPVREGIYKFYINPQAAGRGEMSFEIVSNDIHSTVVVRNVMVYDDDHEAYHAAEDAKATSSNGVVFTKEMSWKVDFSTDSCRKMPFGQVIHTIGRVQPSQGDEYAITAKADGIVSITGELTEGKSVRAGQTLFSIESNGLAEGNLDVRYQEAENNYQLAKAEYERKQTLAADNIVSNSDLQQARTRYENAKTLYQNLKRNFSAGRQSVGTPISGYIRQLSVRNGDFVHAGQTMAVVSQNRDLFVKAEVQPKYYPMLSEIASATFRSPATGASYTLEKLGGQLISYGKSVDLQHPLIPILFRINNTNDWIPGSFVELRYRSQWQQHYAQAVQLRETVERYGAVFSQHDNADLLYKAYTSGEMPLLNYLLETEYYLSAYAKQLQAQRELELTLSELNVFSL